MRLFNESTKNWLPWKPETQHVLPGTSEVLSFEGFAPMLAEAEETRLVAQNFRVVCHWGHVAAIRIFVRAPMGVYTSPLGMVKALFPPHHNTHEPPEWLEPHPLVYQIPAGVVGAGLVLVRDVVGLRGLLSPGAAFKMNAAQEREMLDNQAVQVLRELGFQEKA